ncbi:PA2169 family four-helix-bundle protein [soil metagenome]
MKNEKALEVLNDLLRINNDRVEGYVKASEESKERDLKSLFRDKADESRNIAMTLTQEITKIGGEPAVGDTTTSGKIYRVWMAVKATFNGKDREGILEACEYGEDAAQSAYKTALGDEDLSSELRELITEQKSKLMVSHDEIKSKRDEAKISL